MFMVENTKVPKTITSNSNRNFNRVLEFFFKMEVQYVNS